MRSLFALAQPVGYSDCRIAICAYANAEVRVWRISMGDETPGDGDVERREMTITTTNFMETRGAFPGEHRVLAGLEEVAAGPTNLAARTYFAGPPPHAAPGYVENDPTVILSLTHHITSESELNYILAPAQGGSHEENMRIKHGMRGRFPPDKGKGKGKGKAPAPRPPHPPPGAPPNTVANSSDDDTSSSSAYGWTVTGKMLKPRRHGQPGFLERMHRIIRRSIGRVQRLIDETDEGSPALGRLQAQLRSLRDKRENTYVALAAERQRLRAMRDVRVTVINGMLEDPVRARWHMALWAVYNRMDITYPLGPDAPDWQMTEVGHEDHQRNMLNRIKLYRLLLTPPDEDDPVKDLDRVKATIDGLYFLHRHHRKLQSNYPEHGYLVHIRYPANSQWGGAVDVSVRIRVPASIRDYKIDDVRAHAGVGRRMHTCWDEIKTGVITESTMLELHEDMRIDEYEKQLETLRGMEDRALKAAEQNLKRPRIEVDQTNDMNTLREELGVHPGELRGTADFPYYLRISAAMKDDVAEDLLDLERDEMRQLNLNLCEEVD